MKKKMLAREAREHAELLKSSLEAMEASIDFDEDYVSGKARKAISELKFLAHALEDIADAIPKISKRQADVRLSYFAFKLMDAFILRDYEAELAKSLISPRETFYKAALQIGNAMDRFDASRMRNGPSSLQEIRDEEYRVNGMRLQYAEAEVGEAA